MALEEKNGIFYEVLIRGNTDPLKGELGAFAGAHFIEANVILRDGKKASVEPGAAQVLPRDKIEQYLGKAFVDYEAAVREIKTQAKTTADASSAAIRDMTQQLVASQAQVVKLQAALEKAQGHLRDISDSHTALSEAVQSAAAVIPA